MSKRPHTISDEHLQSRDKLDALIERERSLSETDRALADSFKGLGDEIDKERERDDGAPSTDGS